VSVLVFGGGYLGRLIAGGLLSGLSFVDIADRSAVLAEIRRVRPTLVVNAAGKTGRPNIDWCREHVLETMRANVSGPIALAETCAETDTHLVHLGSGCIFTTPNWKPSTPWAEDMPAEPLSVYSRSKYAADLAIGGLPHVTVLRVRMPISGAPHPRNLITKLAGYKRVVDATNSVTVVNDLVEAIAQIEKMSLDGAAPPGIFHAVNPGIIRHKEILELYKKHVYHACSYELLSEADFSSSGLVSEPRSHCVLSSRLPSVGIRFRHVAEAVESAMTIYGEILRGGEATSRFDVE
jgi:dTDP-4-dehydrorhamnose reductase